MITKIGITKLNLGCGFQHRPKKQGWLNTDFDKDCNPDMILDITKAFPFENNSFDYIYASHVLEHVTGEQVYTALKECWRVLKDYGMLEIIGPHYKHESAFDLDHKSFITIEALRVFEPNYSAVSSKKRIVQGCHFNIIEAEYRDLQVFVKMKKVYR